MRFNKDVSKIRDKDIYGMLLFALANIKDIPEYSSISQLCYILDKKNLLKLCQFFGGLTIKIPTIEDLEMLLYTLLLYQYINVDNMTFDEAIKIIGSKYDDVRVIKTNYCELAKILDKYDFNLGEASGKF